MRFSCLARNEACKLAPLLAYPPQHLRQKGFGVTALRSGSARCNSNSSSSRGSQSSSGVSGSSSGSGDSSSSSSNIARVAEAGGGGAAGVVGVGVLVGSVVVVVVVAAGVFNIEFDFGWQRRNSAVELKVRAEVEWEADQLRQAWTKQLVAAEQWTARRDTRELGQLEKLFALGCFALGCSWGEGGMMSKGTHDWSRGNWSNCPEELKGPWEVQPTLPHSFQSLNQFLHILTPPTAKHKKTPANQGL